MKIQLVLHGGSGTGDENIRKACTLGINKVNVCSELLKNVYLEIEKADWRNENIEDLWKHIQDGYKTRLKELMKINGSAGKSWTEENTAGISCKKTVFGEGDHIPHFI